MMRGLSQRDAAERAGSRQRAVGCLEYSHGHVQLDTLRMYLGALGYAVGFGLRDTETGEAVSQVVLPLPTA
jgi:transcriptional regulator with XRE-family HTH domain